MSRLWGTLITPDDVLRHTIPGLIEQVAEACDEKAKGYDTVSVFSAWARAIREFLPLMRKMVDSDLELARQCREEQHYG